LGLSKEWLKACTQQREQGTREFPHGESLSYVMFSDISDERLLGRHSACEVYKPKEVGSSTQGTGQTDYSYAAEWRPIMKFRWILALCFALTLPVVAQSADNEPASCDEVILHLRTMHSHDMMKRVLEVQSPSMQKVMQDQLLKDKGSLPPDYQTRMAKWMDDLIRNMPVVREETEAVVPMLSKYLSDWKDRMEKDLEADKSTKASPVQQVAPAHGQLGSDRARIAWLRVKL
jgi:hypothetical protein